MAKAKPNYLYKDIAEIENILGYKVNDVFKDGFAYARLTMDALRKPKKKGVKHVENNDKSV